MAENKMKVTKESLVKECEFLLDNKYNLLRVITSNRAAINDQYRTINNLFKKGIDDIENLVELNNSLSKINTFIIMAFLNSVEDNSLEIKYITRIPSLLFKLHLNKLKILKTLKISGKENYLIGLPAEIGYIYNLEEMDLSDCLLSKIPKEISLLKKLEKLILNSNLFSELPKEIGELPKLKELNICYNPLLTELPEEIGNLSALQTLNVHHDNLQSIPASIGRLNNLKTLNLGYNQLNAIPTEIGNISMLEVINIQNNQIKKLPEKLLEIETLREIDVEGNEELDLPVDFNRFLH